MRSPVLLLPDFKMLSRCHGSSGRSPGPRGCRFRKAQRSKHTWGATEYLVPLLSSTAASDLTGPSSLRLRALQPSWNSSPTTAAVCGCAPACLRGCLRCVRQRTETAPLQAHLVTLGHGRAAWAAWCAAPAAATAVRQGPLALVLALLLLIAGPSFATPSHDIVHTSCTRAPCAWTSRSPPPQGGVATTTMTTRPTRCAFFSPPARAPRRCCL